MNANSATDSDEWSEWLLRDRHAGDAAYAARVRAAVIAYADRVLDNARLAPGVVLADIGSGEGLVGLRAIERAGASLRVVMTDLSAPMLRHAEAAARQRGVADQCTFHHCPADNLGPIQGSSVDVVTTRAVLAYVADKRAALREFHRILRPGGRISLCEPVFQDEAFHACALRNRVAAGGVPAADRFVTLLHRWKAAQFPDTQEACARSPLANYSERDILYLARDCGFTDIHLELHLDVTPAPEASWDIFLGIAPHPWAPPLRRILEEQFSADERAYFEATLRPRVESGEGVSIGRVLYLTASKPGTARAPAGQPMW